MESTPNGKRRLVSYAVALILLLASVSVKADAVVTPGQASVAVVSVYWGQSQVNPVEAAPGDRNTALSVELQNTGTLDISVVEALLDLAGTPFTSTLGEPRALAGGPVSIRVGSRGTLEFSLDIAEAAALGVHVARMSVYYLNVTAGKLAIPVDVRVPLLGRAAIRVSSSTLFASSGNNTIGVMLFNEGCGRASRVQATLGLPSSLMLFEGRSQWSWTVLEPGGSTSFAAVVYVPESAGASTYTYTVDVTYVGPYGSAQTSRAAFNLVVLKAQRSSTELSVTISPLTAPAGVSRRISGRLIRMDTGAGIPEVPIAVEFVDPRMNTETRNYTTSPQGYWEETYVPQVDGSYTLSARFEGGPSLEDASTVFEPSRAVASFTAALALAITCPEPWQVTSAGEEALYALRITNQGSTADRFLLELENLPAEFEGRFYSDGVGVKAIEVPAGASMDLRLVVKLPEKVDPATYTFKVRAEGEYARASYDLAATVQEAAGGIELASPLLSLTVATGESLSYPVRITNLGVRQEQIFVSMNMTSELLDWRASFTADGQTVESLVLGPGEGRWVIFRALPPYLVKVGQYPLIVYAATADGRLDDSLLLTGEIRGSYRLEMGFDPQNVVVYTGERGEVTVRVMNRGLSPVTGLRLEVTAPKSLTVTTVPLSVISLAPQEDITFLVRVSAPATATLGDFNMTVTAVCLEGSFGPSAVPISVESSIPWYWISIGLAAVGAGFAALALERLLRRLRIKAKVEQST